MTSSLHKAFLCSQSEKRLFKIVASLLFVGADPNALDDLNGDTPLHVAVLYKLPRVVRLLLCWGASMNIENNKGLTPWTLAYKLGDWSIIHEMQKFLYDQEETDKIKIVFNGYVTPSVDNFTDWKTTSSFGSFYNESVTSNKESSDDFFSCVSSSEQCGLDDGFFTAEGESTLNADPDYSVASRSSDWLKAKNRVDFFPSLTTSNTSECSILNKCVFDPDLSESQLTILKSSSSRHSLEEESLLAKEYVYVDEEQNISFVERRLPVLPKSDESIRSVDTDILVRELTAFGRPPGPINRVTKQVYRKQYARLKANPELASEEKKKEYSKEVQRTLNDPGRLAKESDTYRLLEQKMILSFDNCFLTRNQGKKSFTYLLLDPRLTRNLPLRAVVENMQFAELWKTFVGSIFYVGKGTRSRSYAHLYEAKKFLDGTASKKESRKLQRITDIWNSSHGVVSLHVFQNVTPAEAFTREAAMIEALGLQALTNAKQGEYHGLVSTWRCTQRKDLGVWLLHQALHVFLAEGERHIRPVDLT